MAKFANTDPESVLTYGSGICFPRSRFAESECSTSARRLQSTLPRLLHLRFHQPSIIFEARTMTLSIPTKRTRSLTARFACVLRAFFKKPMQVATIVPSSGRLIRSVADRESVRAAQAVVELGPGAGGTTEGLLANMRADARLLAIEKTAVFDEALAEIHDPRLDVEIADATDLLSLLLDHGMGQVDVIVSGIPFSSLPAATCRTIMQSIYQSLKPGGTFIAYQLHGDVKHYARPLFGPPTRDYVRWNLPPLTVYTWTKVVAKKSINTKKKALAGLS